MKTLLAFIEFLKYEYGDTFAKHNEKGYQYTCVAVKFADIDAAVKIWTKKQDEKAKILLVYAGENEVREGHVVYDGKQWVVYIDGEPPTIRADATE